NLISLQNSLHVQQQPVLQGWCPLPVQILICTNTAFCLACRFVLSNFLFLLFLSRSKRLLLYVSYNFDLVYIKLCICFHGTILKKLIFVSERSRKLTIFQKQKSLLTN